MRLAIIRQRYTPYGGAERFVEGALEALLERNVAITLYTREWPKTRLQLIEPHIVDPPFVGRLWRDFGFARAVTREVGRARLDLVQSHERLLCCDVYRAGDGVHAVWLDERLRGAPAWRRAAVRANPWHRYVMATERRLYASPWLQAVICNSAMVRDEILARFRIEPGKLRVVHNAVDANAFSPALRAQRAPVRATLGIAEEAVVYLLVGSGYERKGVATALEALAALPPPAHLVVVGHEKHAERYRRLAARLGVASRCSFAGPQADPKPFFGAADAFVLPTLYDPLPNAALEAMACALPVITTTKSGAAELVQPNDAGFVCRSRDAEALAAHMRALLDPQARERMGGRARAAVLPLTPEAMTLSLVLLYKELLEQSARRQKRDTERKLAEHRRAWSERVAGPGTAAAAAAEAAPPSAEAAPPDLHAATTVLRAPAEDAGAATTVLREPPDDASAATTVLRERPPTPPPDALPPDAPPDPDAARSR